MSLRELRKNSDAASGMRCRAKPYLSIASVLLNLPTSPNHSLLVILLDATSLSLRRRGPVLALEIGDTLGPALHAGVTSFELLSFCS